jgi:hypothetical protein
VPSYPIKVRFTDLDDNRYTVFVKEPFAKCTGALANCPDNREQIVDKTQCRVLKPNGDKHPKSDTWCNAVNPYQKRENDQAVVKSDLIYQDPVNYLP